MMKVKSLTILTPVGPDKYLNVDFSTENNILVVLEEGQIFRYPLYNVIFYKFAV